MSTATVLYESALVPTVGTANDLAKNVQALMNVIRESAGRYSKEQLLILPLHTPNKQSAEEIAAILERVLSMVQEIRQDRENQDFRLLVEALTPKGLMPDSRVREAKMEARARAEVLKSASWLTAKEIADRCQFSKTNPSAQPSKWKSKGSIFSIRYEGVERFPAYALDLDDDGRPLPQMAKVLKVLGDSKSGWGLAVWFWSPNSYLGGHRPQDWLRKHPDEVIAAARAEGEGVQHG